MKTRVIFVIMMGLMLSFFNVWAKKKSGNIPLIGSAAPAFTAETTQGRLQFPGDFGKNWKVLFSHPMDFTPVCSTEIMELSRLQEEFEKLNTSIAIISTDTHAQHDAWKHYLEELLEEENLTSKIRFPLIEDHKARVSRLYGMMHPESNNTKNVRGVFIIDPDNVVKAITFYPNSTGRNIEEILRTIRALQVTYSSNLFTPVNWKPGDDLIVPFYPFANEELAVDPSVRNGYYLRGHIMWFKKGK